jgi:AraC family transcriptional regulator, exoenzyme S synthesis regulatory protein ExsA
MSKDIYHLPDFFTGGQNTDVHIQFYAVNEPSVKNKVIFSQNLIGFMQQGVKQIISPLSEAKIDNTQFFLLTSGSVLMSESVSTDHQYKAILLFFSNDFLNEFIVKHKINFSKKDAAGQNLKVLKKDTFIQNFEESIKLLDKDSIPQLRKIKLEELLLYLLSKYPEATLKYISQAREASTESKVRQVVLSSNEKSLTIEELAFLCNMSASTFKRNFAELFQTSPKKYFTTNRMQLARQYLRLNKRASEIYMELGYESLSSFSIEFKKHFGISPKHFQDQLEPKA